MTFPPSSQEFLDPATFRCIQCGQCCRPIVKVREEEISRIEKAGINRDDFLDFDPNQKNSTKKTILKRKNGVCMFLYRKGEMYYCRVYGHRPDTCRRYPFISGQEKLKDCRPPRWQYGMELKELVEEVLEEP